MPDPVIELDFGMDAMFGGADEPAPAAQRPASSAPRAAWPGRLGLPRERLPEPDRKVSAVLTAEFNQLDWVPVRSSNLEYVAYTPGVGRFWVWFLRQPGSNARYTVYAFDWVPKAVFDSLMAAPSKGVYFARNIKNKYPTTPIV